jgi:hypothetical protein
MSHSRKKNSLTAWRTRAKAREADRRFNREFDRRIANVRASIDLLSRRTERRLFQVSVIAISITVGLAWLIYWFLIGTEIDWGLN